MKVFLDSNDDLRSGWRFALHAVVFALFLLVVRFLLSALGPSSSLLLLLALNAVALFIPATAALVFMSHFVDRVSPGTFGIQLKADSGRHFIFGLALSAALLVVLVALAAALGRLDMKWNPASRAFEILATIAILMVAAANEELLFRGYPMQVLIRGIGRWPAALLMAALFGSLHLMNPNATAAGIINTVLAGILLSAAYLKSRALWFPYGIHVGWNVGLGVILGFPVSGINLASLWISRPSDAGLVLGGSYGPEGGLLATLVFAAGVAAIGFIKRSALKFRS